MNIPFLNGKPQWWQGDKRDSDVENYEFKETFRYLTYSRVNSSCKLVLAKSSEYNHNILEKEFFGTRYEVFMTDVESIINKMHLGEISGTFTFVKRGQNYGIKLVK